VLNYNRIFELTNISKMKTKLSLIIPILLVICQTGNSQTISLSFSGLKNGLSVPLEKIKIENLDKSCDTTLFYPDSVMVLHALGIDNPAGSENRLVVYQNSPNPVTKTTSIKIFNPSAGIASVIALDLDGKILCTCNEKLAHGYHNFEFSPGTAGTFLISVTINGLSQSIKVISSLMKENGFSTLKYTGSIRNNEMIKEANSGGFVFDFGNHLRFTAYYNLMTKVIEDTPQNNKNYTFEFDGSVFICGQFMTINHKTTSGVAPVNKTTTYYTVTNIPGETSKCWITSNLGSDRQATAVDDSTESSAGWYWQFNRKQGYKHSGSTVTPSWTIDTIYENSEWLTDNDPCTLELGNPWRLPTNTEWINVSVQGGWNEWNGPWNSGLKIHAAGYILDTNGSLISRGVTSSFWSSVQSGLAFGIYFWVRIDYISTTYNYKARGYTLRCLRN
jgi:hypothetical protein